MAAQLLDGKALAAETTAALTERVAALARPPGLVVVLVGEDPASQVYTRNKAKTAEKLGIRSQLLTLPAETPQAELLALVQRLNADDSVDGVLIQLPLPKHIDSTVILDAIDPAKDVDGFHAVNVGLLSQKRRALVPCTPKGVMALLAKTGASLKGLDAVVVGRSNIVGLPMIQLLLQADCTVTCAHRATRDLPGLVQRADVVVAAVGVRELVRGSWIKEGALVIDVGINRTNEGKLVGDVEFAPAAERAAWITPVPGGVGPMTIAMLMQNTVEAAEARRNG